VAHAGTPAVQPAPAFQAIPAVASNPAYFTGDGNRGRRIAVLVPDAVGLPAEQGYLPTLVQGVLVGDLSRFSAMTVLDRQSLESVLFETESGLYQSPEDFGRLGQIVNVDYVLTGSITRTGKRVSYRIRFWRYLMKKTFLRIGFISLILSLGLIFVGCPGRGSPSNVVRQLHAAVDRGDTGRISELMTADAAGITLKMLDYFQESYAESGGIARMEETVTGNTAVVHVTYRNGETDTYDLVRVDGRWLVTIAK
jgi:hypothetical protein